MRISDWSSDVCSSDLPALHDLVTGVDVYQSLGVEAAREGFLPGDRQDVVAQADHVARGDFGWLAQLPVAVLVRSIGPGIATETLGEGGTLVRLHVVAEHLRKSNMHFAGARVGRPADFIRVADRKRTRLNSSHECATRMPSS